MSGSAKVVEQIDWNKVGPELLAALKEAEVCLWLVATSGNEDAVRRHRLVQDAIRRAEGR